MKRTFSWPLFLAAAGVLTAATWFLVESRETRIAGTISAVAIAWGFVRFCVVHDAPTAAEVDGAGEFNAGDAAADSLVRNDVWSREGASAPSAAQFEVELKLPLLAVVRPSGSAEGRS
jgi:hypothetical protein